MLADIAPSVAGWPAAKPKIAEAASATTITPTPTLKPLMMCCPTRSFDKFGGRGQRSVKGQAPLQAAVTVCFSASTARAAVGLRPAPL